MRQDNSFRFQSFEAGEGVCAHVLPTRKFKTTTVCLLIGRELDERNSYAALLGEVLKRGSAKYPDMRAIARETEEMYGASFGAGVSRIGGKQVLTMRLTLPNERYLPGRVKLLEKGFRFLEEMLLRPLAKGGAFADDKVKLEKANLVARIISLMNDKMEYAQKRCVEEMCRGERFRFFEYGEAADVARITPRGLFSFYEEILSTRPVHAYVVGDVAAGAVVERVGRMFRGRKKADYSFAAPEPQPAVKKARRIGEKQDLEQAKICLGLRTYSTVRDADYPAALIYNGVLGAFPHSKLFRSVREKAGLAYDAHSYIENSRGLIIIGAGTEAKDVNRALKIIEAQLDEMRRGKISRDEMSKTRKALVTRLKSSVDSPLQLMHMNYSQKVNGVETRLDEWARKISRVTVADVREVARKTALDTVYTLMPRKAEGK